MASSILLRRSARLANKRQELIQGDDLIRRRWEDLDSDVLVRIFQTFDVTEVTTGAAPIGQICSNWRKAARDPILWKKLDLTELKSEFMPIPSRPHVYVLPRSDKLLTRVLKVALSLSRGQIRTIMFDYYCFPTEDQFFYFAKRCPNLRRLVLPAWNRIRLTSAEMRKGARMWPHLESLTLCTSTLARPENLLLEISLHCPNITELKIIGPCGCDVILAAMIAVNFPDLKVLSLRCSGLVREALIVLLDQLRSLERLNIAHCLLADVPDSAPVQILNSIDGSILQRASHLREFVTCMSGSCATCQRTRADSGMIRWHEYEDLWKVDELPSLAV